MRLPIRAALGVVACLLLPAAPAASEEAEAGVVEDGRKVSIEYTLKLDDGSTADTNVGKEPLVYEHGSDSVLLGFQDALSGLGEGEKKKFTLAPSDGYGEVNEELVEEVDTELIPEEARVAGATLFSQGPGGRPRMVRVREVNGDKTVVDFNHPLAGETLHFDVKVVGIE